MAMELVSTVTVGSGGAASIEFTNIPQTGKDLLVKYSIRRSNTNDIFDIDFNSFEGTYSNRRLDGDGSTASSRTITGEGIRGYITTSSDTSNTFASVDVYVANYTSSVAKSISVDGVTENNATSANQFLIAASASTTNPVTSLRIQALSLVQHSSASLYIIS